MHLRVTVLLLLLLGAPALAAQQVELTLREEGTRAPIAGAIVRLLDDSSRAVAQGLTSDAGRITLRAPGPGQYRIKADRIGWVGVLTGEFPLAAGQLFPSEMVMPATRLELPTVEVESRSRCGGSTGGREALAVWEEVQKALTASIITERSGLQPLHVREFRRQLRRNLDLVREYNVSSAIRRGRIYTTLPPAELARDGFVDFDDPGNIHTYAVPDAALLLSDEFASTHCFGVVPDQDGLAGLSFAPVPNRRVPEVSGTLWVHRATGELRHLEYRYVNMPGLLSRTHVGGRVEFLRLPSGAWVVGYWYVRTPDLEVAQLRGTGGTQYDLPRHVGYLDLGGRVTIAADTTGRVDHAILQGRVTDRTTGGGLAGVVIQVEGSSESVVTDSAGEYELAVPLFGERAVTARHYKIGLLPGPPQPTWVLSLGDTTRVSFEVPPLARFVRELCGAPGNRSGVVGVVLGPDGSPVEGVEVRATWRTPTGVTGQASARSGRTGLYGLCNLPADERVPIRLHRGPQALAEQLVEVGFRTFSWVDLRLP